MLRLMFQPESKLPPWATIEIDRADELKIKVGSAGAAAFISLLLSSIVGSFVLYLVIISNETAVTKLLFLPLVAYGIFVWFDYASTLSWHFDGMRSVLTIERTAFRVFCRRKAYPFESIGQTKFREHRSDDSCTFAIELTLEGDSKLAIQRITAKDATSAEHLTNRIDTWLDSHRPRA